MYYFPVQSHNIEIIENPSEKGWSDGEYRYEVHAYVMYGWGSEIHNHRFIDGADTIEEAIQIAKDYADSEEYTYPNEEKAVDKWSKKQWK